MMITDLATCTIDTFLPRIGAAFVVGSGGASHVPLTLKSVTPLGQARTAEDRQPFSLLFQGAPALRLSQAIYRFEIKGELAIEIFITQVSATAENTQFEAVFT